MSTTPQAHAARIESGQALVHSLAAKIHRTLPGKIELDDLIGYGELGLAEAARDFDPGLGCQFTTFAYYRIRGAIYDGLSKMSWTSRRQYHKHRFAQLANEALAAPDELAPPAAASPQQNAGWLGAVSSRLGVIFFASGEEGGGVRDSAIADPRATASSIVAQREITQRLRALVDELPEVERRLVSGVYFEGRTMQDVAVELGLSKSWASRLHARALDKLGQSLRRLGAESAN